MEVNLTNLSLLVCDLRILFVANKTVLVVIFLNLGSTNEHNLEIDITEIKNTATKLRNIFLVEF